MARGSCSTRVLCGLGYKYRDHPARGRPLRFLLLLVDLLDWAAYWRRVITDLRGWCQYKHQDNKAQPHFAGMGDEWGVLTVCAATHSLSSLSDPPYVIFGLGLCFGLGRGGSLSFGCALSIAGDLCGGGAGAGGSEAGCSLVLSLSLLICRDSGNSVNALPSHVFHPWSKSCLSFLIKLTLQLFNLFAIEGQSGSCFLY